MLFASTLARPGVSARIVTGSASSLWWMSQYEQSGTGHGTGGQQQAILDRMRARTVNFIKTSVLRTLVEQADAYVVTPHRPGALAPSVLLA